MRRLLGAAVAVGLSIASIVGPSSAATTGGLTIAQATNATSTGTVSGRIIGDNGNGVARAMLIFEGGGRRQTINADPMGTFAATLPPGIYTVTISRAGFQSASTEVTVAGDSAATLNVTLTTASLNNLNVIGRTSAAGTANAARFNISSTPTQAITSAQIQARNVPDLTELVSELPGVTIPHATSNPNEGFVLRGLRYETTVTLDGHPISSGTQGIFITNYAASQIFGGVDVFKGGGLEGPITGESGIGIVNLRTPDYTAKDTGYFQAGLDNYGGSFYTALVDVNLTADKKLSLIAGKTFTGYRGPTYGLTEPDGSLASIPPYGTFQVPQNLTNGVIPYIQDFSDTYSLNGELAKLRYRFSDATSLGIEFLGLEGRFDPQGGAYGQFEGFATIPQCLNAGKPGKGAACTDLSTYNSPAAASLIGTTGVPLYAFYPGSDVRQNQPNWNADFKTTIGNDTLLLRPYTAAINRLIDGTQENLVPGEAGNWYQVTNSVNCQAAYVGPSAANGGAKGPCFAGNTNPVAAWINGANSPVVFATTTTPLSCTTATPCYTTPTAINNSGQYGYGSPYTTLELDNLFGYTASYIHPFGANTLNVSFDHYFDDTTDYVNDASPLAAGCTFVYGSSQANLNPITKLPFQPDCKDAFGNILPTLRPTPISVPETFASKSSLGISGQFQVTSKLEFDVGGYYTRYLINAQEQNPATLTPAYIAKNYGGVAAAVPIAPVGIQNSGSHIDPRFGLLYRPTRDLAIRFTAGSSESIPYASLVSGFLSYSLGATSSTISTPNYGLRPETIVQEDLGADYRYSPTGGVFSWDLYNAVVHNPWLNTRIPFCGGPANLGLRACTLNDFPEVTGEGLTTQTLNGAQQYAQGVEFTFTDEPRFGFGYRVNTSFERNYYLGTPPAYFGNTAQIFFNGGQYTSTSSSYTSVPYAKGYGEIQYVAGNQSTFRIGMDYEGNNNSYNAPAFVIFDAGIKMNTGFHDVFISATGENIFGNTFNSLLGRGVEYQGLSPVEGKPSYGGYTYSTPTNTALVSPGPVTFRFSLIKQF